MDSSTAVVTGFVTRQGKILVLKRSERVGTYQGRFAGVSGYLEVEEPLKQMWKELGEELGIGPEDADLKLAGTPLTVVDPPAGRTWLVHPFRFALRPAAEPRLDWEHVAMRWIQPWEMRQLDTVPGLFEAWCRVADHVE